MKSSLIIYLLSIAVSAQDPTYGLCNAENYLQKPNQNKSYPITPALDEGSGIIISGDFYIIDGCNFGLRNYVGYNFQETKIYGANPGSTLSILLSDTSLAPMANPSTVTFELKKVAGSAATFDGFTEVRFFEPTSQRVIATCPLDPLPKGDTGGGQIPGGGSGTGSKSIAKINKISFFSVLFGLISGIFVL